MSSSSSSSSSSSDSAHFDTSQHFRQYEQSLSGFDPNAPSASSSSSSASPASPLQWSASSGVGGLGAVPVAPGSLPAFPGVSLPQLPSASPASARLPDYIGNAGRGIIRERSWGEKITYETGACYVTGGILGALYGAAVGMQEAKEKEVYGKHFKLTLNSVLNHAGKNASELGNRFGVFAAFFSLSRTFAKSYRGKNDVKNDLIGFTTASVITTLPRLGLLGSMKVGAAASAVSLLAIAGRVYYAEKRDTENPPPQWLQNLFTTFSRPPPLPTAYPPYPPMQLMQAPYPPQPNSRS